MKTEVPKERKKAVVYKVPCKDYNQAYIGEMKRNLKVRLTEHKQAVKKEDNKKGIAVHVQNACLSL